jgi:nitronate monooxygenase
MRDLFKTDLPIMQTPMRNITHIDLVVAVCKAGGIGTLDATDISPKQLAKSIQEIRQATDKPFCIHLVVPQPFEASLDQVDIVKQAVRPFFLKHGLDDPVLSEPYSESFKQQMEVILEARVPLFQFSFGVPALSWITKLKQQGTFVIGTASHREEAELLQKIGVDAVVCQALEAYGERVTFLGEAFQSMIPRETLLAEIKSHITIPLIINGGISSTDQVSTALELGADMVQIAMPLLACDESGLSNEIHEQLFSIKSDTAFSNAATGRLARVIRCDIIDELLHYKPFMLPYPLQYALMKPLLASNEILFAEELQLLPRQQTVKELLDSISVEEVVAA